jgi:WD40 repeat protein
VAKDYHGEPLPAGALARFGSLRMRLDGGIADVAFAPDNQAIAVAGTVITKIENNTRYLKNVLWLLDLARGKTVKDFEKVEQPYNQIAYSADGKILAGLSNNSAVAFWDAASGKKLPNEIRLGFLTRFALAPEGNLVAVSISISGGQASGIVFWDRAENKRLAVLEGHKSLVDSLAFSADGKQLTSASRYVRYFQGGGKAQKPKEIILPGQVILWDVAKRSKIREIVHDSSSVVLSGDGSLAAWVPQEGKKIVVVDVRKKGKQITIPGEHHSFLFSPDNKTLVTGKQNYVGRGFQAAEAAGNVIFWDLATGKETHRLEGHVGPASRVLRFSADGKLLATGSWDWGYWSHSNSIRIWDVKTGREMNPMPTHADRIASIACSPDGQIIASGSNDKTIRLWQRATGKPLHLLAGHDGDIKALAFSPDGKTLASAASDKNVRLWDTATGKEKAHHGDLTAPVLALAFTPDGKTLRAAAGDGSVISWQGDKSTIIKLLDKEISLRFAALPSDARTMLAQLGNNTPFMELSSNTLPLWQLPFGKPLGHIQIPGKKREDEQFSGTQCWTAAFSADGRFLATSESHQSFGLRGVFYFNDTLRIWETASTREVLKITGLPSPAQNLVFSADGRFLASSHGDIHFFGSNDKGTTLVWDTADGKKLADLHVQTGAIICAAFVPDGKTLVNSHSDYTLLAWDISRLARNSDLPKNLAAADLKKAWGDLAGNDAPLAYRTIGRLIAADKDSVPFLAKQLPPAPPVDYKRIDPLIADLNSDTFSVRQKAMRELESMGEVTEPALRKALLKKGSLEYRRRIESLLQKLNQNPSGPQLRIIRVLTVLERIRTRASRELLESLAAGAPEVRLTREARAVIARHRR